MRRQISSVKSRGSNSTANSDPKQKVRDCCRNFVAFMCTQVGVGALIVGYALIGAAGFRSIETQKQPGVDHFESIDKIRSNYSTQLWRLMERMNTFNHTSWKSAADAVTQHFQDEYVVLVKQGYTGRTPEDVWSFPAALMYCMSVFSMIGYGNMVPKTPWGKGATMIYATFGIPLYILYFLNIGRVLANTFKVIYTWIHECSHDVVVDTNDSDDLQSTVSQVMATKKVIVPSTAGLWVVFFYVAGGTIMFAEWEGWDYLDSVYFCVTSLCKIGFGDFVPGANIADSQGGKQTKLAINFVYVLFGMGLVAMCFNLMREEVREKMAEMREDMRLCMEDIQKRFTRCCGGGAEAAAARERQLRRSRRRSRQRREMDMGEEY